MTFTNFKKAKKEANRIGGVVLWWVSYFVIPAKEYNESDGIPKYVSKKAELYFLKKYKKSLEEKQKEFIAFKAKLQFAYERQVKEVNDHIVEIIK